MVRRRSLFALALAVVACGCGYGRRGYYELVPERQFQIVTDDGAREALLQFMGEFAAAQRFTVSRENHPSAASAPSIFWVLEQSKGMIVFQNRIVGEEPDPAHPGSTLDRHSQTDFSVMFYRSMFGYSDEELAQLIELFGAEVSAVDGVREFFDQFPRTTP